MIELTDTSSPEIAQAFVKARTRAGSPAMSMVMTFIVVVDEDSAEEAMAEARRATHEHPARVLGIILGSGRDKSRVHAQVGIGEDWGGEAALIRLTGEVIKHADSVVLPLLLPDSPVAIWWPNDPPAAPASDPLGALAKRRITDAASVTRGKTTALDHQCENYVAGNTDLAWTRITPWRALLAAAMDQGRMKVQSASVTAERVSPSADLLAQWLRDRLKIEVTRSVSGGPGITEVVLNAKEGPTSISRQDGRLATFAAPGRPDQLMALKRRKLPELLAEELRWLDEDDVYAATVRSYAKAHGLSTPPKKTAGKKASGTKSSTKKSSDKKASGKKTTKKSTASTGKG